MTAISAAKVGQVGTKLYLLWAGLSAGVAFLATPAKFLAPELSLPVALAVGQQTFRVYNAVEIAFVLLLLVLGRWLRTRRRWYLVLAVPAGVVLAQALWLMPALDLRVAAIRAGASQLPPSNLHSLYIAAEALKLLWLLVIGSAGVLSKPPRGRVLADDSACTQTHASPR